MRKIISFTEAYIHAKTCEAVEKLFYFFAQVAVVGDGKAVRLGVDGKDVVMVVTHQCALTHDVMRLVPLIFCDGNHRDVQASFTKHLLHRVLLPRSSVNHNEGGGNRPPGWPGGAGGAFRGARRYHHFFVRTA